MPGRGFQPGQREEETSSLVHRIDGQTPGFRTVELRLSEIRRPQEESQIAEPFKELHQPISDVGESPCFGPPASCEVRHG